MKPLILILIGLSLFLAPALRAQTVLYLPESQPFNANFLEGKQQCLSLSIKVLAKPGLLTAQDFEALRHWAWQLQALGERTQSRDVFEQVLHRVEAAFGKQSKAYYDALLDLARAQTLVIRYDLALSLYREALSLAENRFSSAAPEVWKVQAEMASYLGLIGQTNEAMSHYLNVIQKLEKQNLGESIYAAIIDNNIGVIRQQQGLIPQAEKHYAQALDRFVKLNLSLSIEALASRSNLAHAYHLQGKKEALNQELNFLENHSAKLYQRRDFFTGRVLFHLAEMQALGGRLDLAETNYKAALLTNSLSLVQIDNIGQEAEKLMFDNRYIAVCTQIGILTSAAQSYERQYRQTGQKNYLNQSSRILQTLSAFEARTQTDFSSEADKLILFQIGANKGLKQALNLAYEYYKLQDQAQLALAQAFQLAERSKSTLLLQALQDRKNQKNFGRIKPEYLQEERQLRQKYQNIKVQLLETEEAKKQQALRQELNDLGRALESLRRKIQTEYPEDYRNRYQNPIAELQQVQAQLKQGEVQLNYSLADTIAHVFVISKDTVLLLALPQLYQQTQVQADLLRLALSNYEAIQKQPEQTDKQFRLAAQYFYKTFVQPALEGLGSAEIKHLQIVPDGVLAHLPFEVFLTEEPALAGQYRSYPYLIKAYTLSYAYSASLDLGYRQQARRQRAQKTGVLGFAPSYTQPNRLNPQTEFAQSRSDQLRRQLQPLPAALQEVGTMQQYLYGDFHLNQQATEAKFKREAPKYKILHLAMHGLLNSEEPLRSSLAFTEDNNSVEDNFLHAYEISQLELQADLVVLSACETGYGQFQQGEGVMSLAHAFMYAGASSVLMSLWQVNDASTALIMEQYYRRLAQGLSKDQTLREAKLHFLETAPELAAHPAYWAAFVQLGDIKPIGVYCKQVVWLAYGFWLLPLGLGLAWWYKRKNKIKQDPSSMLWA